MQVVPFLVNLSIISMMFNALFLFFDYRGIIRNIRLSFGANKGLGLVLLLGKDRRLKMLVKNLRNSTIKENGHIYDNNPESISMFVGHVPCQVYKEGEAQPRNLYDLKRDEITDSESLNDTVEKAFSAGQLGNTLQQKVKDVLLYAALGGIGLLIFLVFNLQDSITKISHAVL